MKKYKGILELKNGELFIKNINTRRLVKVPYYCKGAIYKESCGAFKGEFGYNIHLNEWTFTSWQNTNHEINVGDLIEFYK